MFFCLRGYIGVKNLVMKYFTVLNSRKNNDLCIPPQWKGFFFSMKPTPVEVSFKLHFVIFYMQVFEIPCAPPLEISNPLCN